MTIIDESKADALEKQVKITIPSADIEQKYQGKMLEVQGMAVLPGYRRGKAPSWLILKQFGDSIYQDVVKEALEDSVKDVVKDQDIVQAPELAEFINERGKDLSFTLKFEVFPQITIPNFQEVSIEKPTFKIVEKDIQKNIERIVENQTKFDIKEGVADKNDAVVINVSGVKSNGEHFPAKKMEGVLYRLNKDYTLSKKFDQAIVGAKAGDELEIAVDYDSKFDIEHIAGDKVTYSVKVISVNECKIPELDDELAKNAGYEALDALKADLIKGKEAEYDSQIYTLLSMRLFDGLENLLTFDVPKSILTKEVESISAEIENLKKDDTDLKGKSEDELKKYAEKFAYRRIRIGMMLQEYAKQKKLQPDFEDIKKAVVKRVSMFPEYMQQEMLNWYYKSPENLSSISGSALEQKVVEYILSNEGVQLSEKLYDVSEIADLVEKQTEKKMY